MPWQFCPGRNFSGRGACIAPGKRYNRKIQCRVFNSFTAEARCCLIKQLIGLVLGCLR
jgi:hypothetical protein